MANRCCSRSVDARNAVEFMQLVDGVDVGSRPQVYVLGDRSGDDLVSGRAHDLLQPTVDDVLLSGTLQQQVVVELLVRNVAGLLDDIKEVLLGLLLPLALHASGPHVVEVLEPLEVADGDAASIAEDVWQELDTFI